MKLLLDEMISPRVARELQGRGFDVQAITGERAELKSTPDEEIVRRIAAEPRVIVTNNVRDFHAIHERLLARGEEHAGMIFTLDSEVPRSNKSLALWVDALAALLKVHPTEHDLRNRTTFATPVAPSGP